MNPLNLVTDAEVRQMRIESVTVYPRNINEQVAHFVLPHKGYLSADSRLVIPLVTKDKAYQLPCSVGLHAIVKTATLSTPSSGVIAQVDEAGQMYANLNHLTPPEKKNNIDAVLHGVNYTFETASGGRMNTDADDIEVFAGQYRLKCDNYEKQTPSDRCHGGVGNLPNMLDGSNALLLDTDSKKTPQFSLSLQGLFPGFFNKGTRTFPVSLLEEELLLDIVFSDNGDWGANDRAVFCPTLASETGAVIGSSIVAIGVKTVGEAPAGTTQKNVVCTQTHTTHAGTGFRMLMDIDNGVTSDYRVLDTGVGYVAGEEVTVHNDLLGTDAVIVPAVKFIDPTDADNFAIDADGGDNKFPVSTGTVVTVVHPTNSQLSFHVKVTADANGKATAVTLPDGVAGVTVNNNLALPVTFDDAMEVLKDDGTLSGCTINMGNANKQTTQGLGYDPIWSYDLISGDKINVDTGNVLLTTDLIYYQDGRPEKDMKLMNGAGIRFLYTQFRNVTSSLTDDDQCAKYGDVDSQPYNRLIGMSNEVVRTIHYNIYPSGTQKKEQFPYYNKTKRNPLLLKYCSRSSLNQNGFRWNMNINSVPHYSSELQTDMRQFRELQKCFGTMFMNKGTYQAWNQARQLDNPDADLTDADPSLQPGFTVKHYNNQPTAKHELSDVKSAITNQHWHGINQHWLRGMNHVNGVSFKLQPGNFAGNGAHIGSQAVDLNFTYDSTYDPWFSGESTLSLFGEVERMFVLKDGQIQITSASF